MKKQFSRANKTVPTEDDEDQLEDEEQNQEKSGLQDFIKSDEMNDRKTNLSSWNDHHDSLSGAYHHRSLKLYAYVIDGGTCIRANTMQSYWELNQQITNLLPTLSHNQLAIQMHPNANVQAKAQVGLECFVGENSYIAEKTTIKNCIIGANCKINEKVKLTNCVIMNNVVINSLNNISGSIICDDVETSEKCEIKDCIVSKGHHFNPEGGN